ncbi:MAG: hypothetical protein ABIJ96_12590 [Elusimicrobiota bacterium]
MLDLRRSVLPLGLAAACLCLGFAGAQAADSASLQFTIPAPNPIQAGETLALQALGVNTGAQTWTAGSYYWVAEVYDLEYNLVARTDQVSPPEDVRRGAVASISLSFRVPETLVGRHLYRIYLVKNAQTLIESQYTPFQVLYRPLPPKPKVVDYRVEGNVTVSYKNVRRSGASSEHTGATTMNAVGKIKESSYLFNAYILHERGQAFDPFILLFTYYAPWGTVYGGDLTPTLSELSVNGQGFRGVMLEQRRGRFDWTVLGGQSIESQAGTSATNGRFARTLYAGKLGIEAAESVKTALTYFLSADEPGSLSTDPDSPKYRGPSLTPQKNQGTGAALSWEPVEKLKLLADYQSNAFFDDSAGASVKDTAWRGELRWERRYFKFKSSLQEAGPDFVAFGAPGIVGDRRTFAGGLSLYPASWYTVTLNGTQYEDNLDNNPARVTTSQRVVSVGNALQLKTGTNLNASMTMNTAEGKPKSALDNQTTTAGLGISQSLGRHSASLNSSLSQFRDNNKLASDLDTMTVSLSGSFVLPNRASCSFGVTQSETKDKGDGSKRTSRTVSPSYSKRFSSSYVVQLWGTLTQTQNDNPLLAADTQNVAANSELTWAQSNVLNLTFGLGYNKNTDKIRANNSYNEIVLSSRLSYSF